MRQVPSIFVITLLDEISINISIPILTLLFFDHHSIFYSAGRYWYGIVSASPHLIAIFSAPILGWLSDHYGRKKLLLIGALGAVIFSSFATLGIISASLSLLIFGYLICGLCVRIEPIALAVIADNSHNKLIDMGYLQFYIALGAFFGPLLGGYFAHRFFFNYLNFSLPYIIAIITGFATIFLIKFSFEDGYIKQKIAIKNSLKELLNSNIIKISLLLACTQFSWRLYYQFIPPILKVEYHYNATMLGIFIAVIALWLAITTLCGIKILNNIFSSKKLLRFAILLELIGIIITIAACQFPHHLFSKILIWLMALPVASGDVIIYCLISTYYSEAVANNHQGKVMGLNFIIVSSIWAATGILGGALSTINLKLPILLAPIGLPIALYFYNRWI